MESNKLSTAIVVGVLFGSFGASAFAGDKLTAERDINWQGQIASANTRDQVANDLRQSGAQIDLVQDGALEYTFPRLSGTKRNFANDRSGAQVVLNPSTAADFDPDLYFGS